MKILLSFLILITFAFLTGPVTAAEPAPVSGRITDAVTRPSVNVMRDGPAEAMGILYKPTSQVSSNAVHIGTTSQQDATTILQDTTTGGTKAMDKKGK